MTMLKAGEKLIVCEVCEHQRIVPIKGDILEISLTCERCEHRSMKVVKVSPTNVSGVGRNKIADLGLAILMEAGAGAPDPEEKEEFS